MITTTYTCDKCGKMSTNHNELNLERVGVFVGQYERAYSYGREPRVELIKEWCSDCRIKAGLLQKPEKSLIEVTQITLEDMIREVVDNAVKDALNER